MNTYRLCLVLLALFVIGCSKSTDDPIPGDDGPNVDANYSVLLESNGTLSEMLLNANAETISKNPTASQFETTSTPALSYRDGKVLSSFTAKPDCSGELNIVDFEDYSVKNIEVFGDLQDCDMEVISLAHSDGSIFLVYSIPGTGAKAMHYFLRILDINATDGSFTEEELEKEPKQLIFSNDKIFALSLDEDEADKFALVVFDIDSGEEIHDVNLDFDAQKIFKTVEGNIMVSYEELHLIINSSTFGIMATVRYNEGKEPKFGAAETAYFDVTGNLYYPMPTDLSGTEYPHIPGVYDFSTNTAILYFYENFLTEAEREFEYKIGDTSMVSYDAENNLILIGYQKSDDNSKGGLLRVKPIPEPKFIDNINLDGVPFELFID